MSHELIKPMLWYAWSRSVDMVPMGIWQCSQAWLSLAKTDYPPYSFNFNESEQSKPFAAHCAEDLVNAVKSRQTSQSKTNPDKKSVKPENAFLIFLQARILATAGKVAALCVCACFHKTFSFKPQSAVRD